MGHLDEYSYYNYQRENEDSEREDEQEEEEAANANVRTEIVGGTGLSHIDHCRKCPACVYLLLMEYNMLTNAYKSIGFAYKYLLTLSVTQVACERSFSALKLIKTNMRSNMSQVKLEAFILIKCNQEIVLSIDNEVIINKVCHHSSAYARELQL